MSQHDDSSTPPPTPLGPLRPPLPHEQYPLKVRERPDNLYRPSNAINEPPTAAWYIVAILAPFIGIILGIVAAARSQTGPALALWASSLIVGPVFWIVFWTMLALGSTS